MRKLSSMLLGCALLLGAGCAQTGGSAANAAPGSKSKFISTLTTAPTLIVVTQGPAKLTKVKQSCKEGSVSLYVGNSSICPGTKPSGSRVVSGRENIELKQGEYLCGAVGGGSGPCDLTYVLGAAQ